jgi:uncharacterized protein (TIGR03086 family)
MADLVELYGRAVGQFGRHLTTVGDRWHAPTPDTEWDVRALVNHVLGENLWAPPLLDGLTIADVGDRFDGDQLGDEPARAWADAAASSIVAVGASGALDRTVHVSFGDIPGHVYVSQLVCDHLIHGWDLARAIGADGTLDTELVDFAFDFLVPQVDGWRSAGVFGPRIELAGDADRQSELLAITGRDPR